MEGGDKTKTPRRGEKGERRQQTAEANGSHTSKSRLPPRSLEPEPEPAPDRHGIGDERVPSHARSEVLGDGAVFGPCSFTP